MPGITGEEETVAGLERTGALDTLSMHRGRPTRLGPGDSIGRYVVLNELGAGGMGVVLAAYDPELDRKVAVKLVRPDAQSTASRERMVREARSMAQLSHANVVSVFDAGEHDGAIFIAMEYVEGATLTDRQPELQGWAAVLDLFVAAGRGLSAAHERGLVHRDFKPDNVMVGDDGRVRVMDFGLARREGESMRSDAASAALELSDSNVSAALGDSLDQTLTREGTLMGTPAYMAPEQFANDRDVDERADQFAFCVALWRALYGERPFVGEGVWGLATAVVKGQRQPAPRGRNVPRWLSAVVERGLAVEPDARWPDMRALLDAIRRGRARRRNRWLGLAVASPLVLGLAAYGGHRAWVGRVAERCQAEARAQMPWPDRAQAVEQGMLSTGLSFAGQSYREVAGQQDGWRESWVELRSEACVDQHVHQALDANDRDARVRCLESSIRRTASFLDLLESGDKTMIVFAVDHGSLVTSLDPCLDIVALSRRPRPGPEVADVVHGAEDRLDSMVVLHLSGRLEHALELGQASLKELEETGFAPAIAGAKAQLGSLLVTMGRPDEARTMLEQAYFSAGAMADDELAAQAARHLVGIGAGPAPYGMEWVRSWASHAYMLHARLDMSDSFEQAEVHESLAYSLADLDQPGTVSEEIALIRRARDIRAARAGADHPAVLVAELNLAAYVAEQDPAASVEAMRAIGARLRAALGSDHPTMVSLLLMTGSALAEDGQATEAVADLDRAIVLAARVHGPDHPLTARAREIREDVVAAAGL